MLKVKTDKKATEGESNPSVTTKKDGTVEIEHKSSGS